MNSEDWSLLGVFSLLSVLAVGGGAAVLPEMKLMTIDEHHWLTTDGFRNAYSIGQLAPGPNMLMVIVIGYHVAGVLGGAIAFVSFFVPAVLITWVASRVWDRFEGSQWRLAVERGMAPLVIGLMLSGTIAIGKTAIDGGKTAAVAIVVFCALYFGKRVSPALLIFGGGIVGWFLF